MIHNAGRTSAVVGNVAELLPDAIHTMEQVLEFVDVVLHLRNYHHLILKL